MSISNLITPGFGSSADKHLYCHALSADNQSYLDGGLTLTTCANGSTAPLPFVSGSLVGDALEIDAGDNTLINVLEDGIYAMELNASWDSNSTGDRAIYITAAGNSAHQTAPAAVSGAHRQNAYMLKKLFVSDVIQARCYQTSGGNLNVNPASGVCRYAITKLS